MMPTVKAASNEQTLWWPHFRRACSGLWQHRRPLIAGLLMAVVVSVFYTTSVSSVIPLLKVIFAREETLVDWMHRVEVQRRLDVVLGADLPNDPGGLLLPHVRPESRSADVLSPGDRIVAIDGQGATAYDIMRIVAQHRGKTLPAVTVENEDGVRRTVELKLRKYHWWSSFMERAVRILPAGRDSASRFNTLLIVMVGLVVVSTLGALARFINECFIAVAVQQTMHDLRTHLADHVLRLPLEWHTQQPPGDTLGRFATDIGKVEVGMSTLFGKTIQEPLKAVGIITLTFMIDWRMLVVALLGLPIGAMVIRALGRAVKRAQKRASRSWGRLLDHLGERLAGIRIVKAYGMEAAESRRFEDEGRTLTRAQSQIEIVDAGTKPALETLALIAVAAFVLYGGSRVFQGDLEPNLFFAAVVCMGGLFDPVRKMGNVNNRLQQADASAKRIFELLDLPEEAPKSLRSGSVRLDGFHDAIEFQDVTFAYPGKPDVPVLQNVTFTVQKGQVVAVVGPNGSGKTTLLSLLMRFYDPQSGRIRIDGRDIRELDLDSLRSQIGLVTQDAVVFSDTVRANVAYGANGVTDAQIVRAARLAHIDDFLQELHGDVNGTEVRGYDTPITARSLSGGQRQRIALARAILRDPPILILDEATSQIDTESERKIQEAIEDVTRGRTTFIIAHRFSTIARADLIVVLNEGRLVDVGRHEDLINSSQFYETLCRTQFAFAES
jgi:subfamily B ATP-binding cassette protein MsbA